MGAVRVMVRCPSCGWDGRRQCGAALPCPRCEASVVVRTPRAYGGAMVGQDGSKVCTRCETEKPFSEFHRRGRDNDMLDSWCKACRRRNTDAWRAIPEHMAAHRLRTRTRVINHYGGRCACCGEHRLPFLAIDHVNGGGTAHRRAINRVGAAFYRWLIREHFPEGFRVLCHNCNLAIGFYGRCPHEDERGAVMTG